MLKKTNGTEKQAINRSIEPVNAVSSEPEVPALDEIDFLNVFVPDDEHYDEQSDEYGLLPEPGDFWVEHDDSIDPSSAA